MSLSPDGRIARANKRMSDKTGYGRDELVGMPFQTLLSVPSRIFYETNISPLLRMQGFVDEVAMDLRTNDGKPVPCLVNVAERRDADGSLLFTDVVVLRAVERRRYERDLVRKRDASRRELDAAAETAQLREQFVAVLGHDLRNPLASISSGIRLLSQREDLSERGQTVVSLMAGSVLRASELVDNVLDFARGRLGGGITLSRNADGPLGPVLEQVVAEIQSVNSGRVIDSKIDLDENIDCDRVRIGQMLSNLLGNAITHGASDQPIEVRALSDAGLFVLEVANGGAPIDDAARRKLFQPFFRGEVRPNSTGLGLGLHIASEIAKAHGGQIDVTSDTQATRFRFEMPLVVAQS
ncbi:PAS domain-containing sensor histidine kinase [Erythrobacter litoralis]|nr:PAS domain-containing sensor histidine kinase [Erythrobacter litoralis]